MSDKPLKIFGWRGQRLALDGPHRQSREICAVRFKADIFRLTGMKPHEQDGACLCETGNAEEIAQAMSSPGTVFWRGLDERQGGWRSDGR